jgi:hypothetical protein
VVVTGHTGDAIWAACMSSGSLLDVGPGYTKASDDLGGDYTEYKLTTDPAGTHEPVVFINGGTDDFTIAAVAIKPR